MNEVPAGPSYPSALQTLGWILRPGPFMARCRATFGDTFTLRLAQQTLVFVSDPEAVKQILTGDPRLLHAGEGNIVLLPLLGRHSVLLLDEQPHMAQRRLLLPPFHGERMHRYGHLIAEIAAAEIDRWPASEPFAVWPRMQAITLEVIMRAVFGIDDAGRRERLRAPLAAMLDWTTRSSRMAMMAVLGPQRLAAVRSFRRAVAPVDAILYDEIRARRADGGGADRDDILSLLVQARHDDGTAMTDQELRDELMTLLVAGHETTATALAWAIERLVRHPEKLARIADETAAGEDAYLDAVVKETLRLRPVLPIVVRVLKEPMEIGGTMLPAGVAVAPCIYLVHRRPDVYPEPQRFLPERFLERPAGTYTWIPFGGGVRRCLGASFAVFEMKTVLAQVASRVRLRPAAPEAEGVARRAITLVPAQGARVVTEAAA